MLKKFSVQIPQYLLAFICTVIIGTFLNIISNVLIQEIIKVNSSNNYHLNKNLFDYFKMTMVPLIFFYRFI